MRLTTRRLPRRVVALVVGLLVLAHGTAHASPALPKAFWLVERNGTESRCGQWELHASGSAGGALAVDLVRRLHTAYWLVTTRARATWDGTTLDVTGTSVLHAPKYPSVRPQPPTKLCPGPRTRTEAGADAWTFDRAGARESWFLTQRACEARRAAAGPVNACDDASQP